MPGQFDFESWSVNRRKGQLRRRILCVAVAVGSLAIMLGMLAGPARAGGSAAQDQYTPPSVAKPKSGVQSAGPTSKNRGNVTSQGATLPFTGLSLVKIVLVGAALLLLGILLRRGLPRRGP